MMKIVVCNVIRRYNLGGLSILMGIDELFRNIYEEYDLVNLEAGSFAAEEYADGLKFKTIQYEAPAISNIFKFLLGKNGLRKIIRVLRNADLIVDLNGICFCENLVPSSKCKLMQKMRNFQTYTVAIVGKKICKKPVVKNTASFGPILSEGNRKNSVKMCRRVFDDLCAREEKSYEIVRKIAGVDKNVYLAPDVAILMPYDNRINRIEDRIAISVSFRVMLNWKAKDAYVDCISELAAHIIKDLGKKIILIPNESRPGVLNDVTIVKEIQTKLEEKGIIAEGLQTTEMNAYEIKNVIAASAMLIGSRYHSCVAALSAGVPTLVIGWHYKYEELLKLFDQNQWMISSEECSIEKLINIFDLAWSKRKESADTILRALPEVKNKIILQGRNMYAKWKI